MVASLIRGLGPRARGLGLEELAGVETLEALSDPTIRLPNGVDDAIFATAASRLWRPELGVWFGAELADERAFGSLGYLARHAANVGEALARVTRYHRLFTSGEPTRIHAGPGSVRIIEGERHAAAWSAVMGDAVLAAWLAFVRRCTGVRVEPLAVEFAYPRRADLGHHRAFFGDALRFDAPAFALELPREVLELPIVGADLVLGALLERQAQELLGLGADGSALVRDIHGAFEAGQSELGDIARALRIEPRTLQRRLAAMGLDLRELRDRHRQRTAERLLADPARSLKEVAAAVGFADATALRRAFVRWTGQAPRERAPRDRAPSPVRAARPRAH